ncbi:senescence-associated gene 21, Arabidopsis thaliana late embryogenensis abundant like 5 [Hibiscus trionum]|uniref:Senescence-associated gene 21, Arabidopsis thaliana late embryogenensis abundant like 5 n=1 Tax=Hibiscus trionum TaxID=183268 RepID=A0A9W7LRE0_HIBTR|nr:senescence-associated gene 21, Arabidopsis thaliana late embryogenensis abundant like 5 [Hibiscus trionum]
MAPSFSNAKLFSTFVVYGTRRGYAAARGAVPRGAARNGAVVKQAREEIAAEKVAWVPDPITGCYRPKNCVNEIDVAELRALLLKKN